jgi:hypothetical protein
VSTALHALSIAAAIGSMVDLHVVPAAVQAGLEARMASSVVVVSVLGALQPAKVNAATTDAIAPERVRNWGLNMIFLLAVSLPERGS